MKVFNTKNILLAVSSVFLFIASANNDKYSYLPIGYFTLLRFIVCAVSIFIAYNKYKEDKESLWAWVFGFTAILFNPFIEIVFKRQTWTVVDLIVGIFFLFYVFISELKNKKHIKDFIIISSIILSVISIFIFFYNSDDWKNTNPKYIYSFEPKYDDTFGFVESCGFLAKNSENNISIYCGDASTNLVSFLDKYSKSINYNYEFITKQNNISELDKYIYSNSSYSGDFFANFIPQNNTIYNIKYTFLNQKISEGVFSDVNAKLVIKEDIFFIYLFLTIIIPIIYFCLLRFVFFKKVFI